MNDTAYYILSYLDTYNSKINEIDKLSSKLFKKDKYHNYANKIKSWYMKYTFDKSVNISTNFNKVNWVKYYQKFYESKYLLDYPEFMAKKLGREDLREWISNNLEEERNRYDVIKFLKLESITVEDILYTGW